MAPGGLPSADLGIIRELAELAQWVCWRLEPNPKSDKKPIKVPVNPKTGRNASVSKPKTWGTYQQAVEHRVLTDGIEGIGFVLTADDPYTCIDLDGVRDAESEAIDKHALNIIMRFATYTEVSPSGTGLHLWIRGTPPGERCRKPGIEVYAKDRYITITGHSLEDLTETDEIEERQAELSALYEETFTQDHPAEPQVAPPSVGAGEELPSSRQWTWEAALPFVTKALTETFAAGPMLVALRKNSRAFRDKWDRTAKRDVERFGKDASAWDMALCNVLIDPELALSWHDLVGLLHACRDLHIGDAKAMRADYWARTIATASNKHAERVERIAEQAQEEEKVHALENIEQQMDSKEGVISQICNIVGIPTIKKITRAKRKNNHIFTIHFSDEDHDQLEGDATLLTSQTKFRNAIASQLLHFVKPMKAKAWGQTATLLLRSVEDEQHLPSISTQQQTIELLQSYFASVPRPPEFASETYLQDGPWWYNGKLILKLSAFEAYLRRVHRITITRLELARRLRGVGIEMERRSYRISGKISSISTYVVPDENDFHDLANSKQQQIEMIEDGEEKEEG